MRRIFDLICAVAVIAFVAGESQADEAAKGQAEAAYPKVVESFQIGGDAYVRALHVSPDNKRLWVGTSLGAMEVDLSTRSLAAVFGRKEGLANEYVFAVAESPDKKVWLGTNAGGVSTLKDGKWKTYFPMHGLADYWVYSFAFENDGDVWVGTWDGASRYSPSTDSFTTFREELVNVWVYGLAVDAKNRVWFGTEGGVSMLDGTTWKSWGSEDGLGAPNVQDLPRSSNTGLGTRSRHDLNVSSGPMKETYNPDYVFAVHEDNRDGSLWFGTWGGGVTQFDGQSKWKSYSKADGLAGAIVYSIAQEKDGTLWFGTNHGATRYDGKKWVSYNSTNGLINDHVYAVAVDDTGSIWLGTKGGVVRVAHDAVDLGGAESPHSSK